jgi:membrane-associated phospholipid phosphatase
VRQVAALSNRCVQLATRHTLRHDVARLASTTAAPAPVASVLLLGVACYSSRSLAEGLSLGVLAAACATVPATVWIEHVLRRGALRHNYLCHSSQRIAPLVIACASVFIASVLVRTLEAPRDLQTVLVTMFFVLVLALAATPVNKISVHMAAITGAGVVLQLLFGTIGLAMVPLVAIVGWSRLELGEHTVTQVISGGVLGAIGASAAYALVA